jgi:hypothetical protein
VLQEDDEDDDDDDDRLDVLGSSITSMILPIDKHGDISFVYSSEERQDPVSQRLSRIDECNDVVVVVVVVDIEMLSSSSIILSSFVVIIT